MLTNVFDTTFKIVYEASKQMALEALLAKPEYTFTPLGSIKSTTIYSNKELNPLLYLVHDIDTISKYSILYLKENDISIVFTNYKNNPIVLNGKVKVIHKGIIVSRIETIKNLNSIFQKHSTHSINKITTTYFIGNFHRIKIASFIEQLICKLKQKYSNKAAYRVLNYKQYKFEDIKSIKSDIYWEHIV